LAWYGILLLLAAFTLSRGIELINGFTNWFFLVILPFGLLIRARRDGFTPRDVLRSIGVNRTGFRNALILAALIVPLSSLVLYFVGEQQRKAIQMIVHDPLMAIVPFSLSFLLALCTAGFVEEFFFRGILPSRLAHFLGSELRALLIASLLFGLFHLPMYFFSSYESTQGNIVWAFSSVITEQAVAGVLLGILWKRTHNLVAPVLLHAFFDALAMMTTLKIGTG
jgi:membrane protease YdiL (CAAX protease family)